MTTKEMTKIISRWFKKHSQATGPLLPDRWLGGRPGERLFCLEKIQLNDNTIDIYLNDRTSLIFEKPKRVYVDNSELVIEGYEKATIKHFILGEKEQMMTEQYNYGAVRFAP